MTLHCKSSEWPSLRLAGIAFLVNVFGLIQYGYPLGVLNLTGPLIKSFINESFIQHYQYPPSSGQITLLYGIANNGWDLGAAVGCVITGIIADKFGRKYAVYLLPSIVCIISSVFFVVSYITNSFELLLIGRVIDGVAGGAACCAVPLYLAELSPVAHRGLVNGWHSAISQIWLVISMVLGLPSLLGTSSLWPLLYCLPVFPAIFGLFATPLLPETPPYLYIIKKDMEKVENTIRRYHGKHTDIDDVLGELRKTAEILTSKMTLREIIADKGTRKGLFLVMCLGLGIAMTGQTLLNHFSTTMFLSAGFHLMMAQYLSIIPAAILVFFAILVPFVVDKFGRRPMILWSIGIQFAGYVVYIAFGVVSRRTDFSDAAYLSITGACIATMGYAIGMGPVVYLLITELVPINAGATTTTIGIMFTFVGGLTVGISYAPANDVLGPICLIPLVILPQIVLFIIVYLKMPETKQRTRLEVYAELLGGQPSILTPLLVESSYSDTRFQRR